MASSQGMHLFIIARYAVIAHLQYLFVINELMFCILCSKTLTCSGSCSQVLYGPRTLGNLGNSVVRHSIERLGSSVARYSGALGNSVGSTLGQLVLEFSVLGRSDLHLPGTDNSGCLGSQTRSFGPQYSGLRCSRLPESARHPTLGIRAHDARDCSNLLGTRSSVFGATMLGPSAFGTCSRPLNSLVVGQFCNST